MDSKTKICLYLITISYITMELIKLWESKYTGSFNSIPWYFYIPLAPVLIGIFTNILHEANSNKK